jgi:hypothetical protein
MPAPPVKPRILELFFLPPQAIGRLGGSLVPLENYTWEEDPTIAGAARTVIEPAVTLDVADDGSLYPYLPSYLRFKDRGLYRPVAPFFELWCRVSLDGVTTHDAPVTTELLERAGASMANLAFTVRAANLKAARRCGDTDCAFRAELRVIGTDHDRHRLLASSTSRPGGEPLVTLDRPIPLGSFQVLRPTRASEMGVNLDIVRVRFTPGTGEVYGPPSATVGAAPGTGRLHTIVKRENRILNPKAAWLRYDADTSRFRNPEPADTYDGADTDAQRAWGVVDDTCDAVIEANLVIDGVDRQAMARVFVGPPDFSPDRRPFASLADELSDRDLPAPPAGEPLDDLERRVNDLFLRALETASLFNLDAVRARAIGNNGTNQKLANMPRTDGESMTGNDRVRIDGVDLFASLSADTFKDSSELAKASVEHHRLPLTELIERAHAQMSDLDVMVAKLREQALRVRHIVRPPYGRLGQLAKDPPASPDPSFRDPRVARDGLHDMRMPPFMRDSDASPLSLTHRQYDELMSLVSQLAATREQVAVQLQAGPAGRATTVERPHPALLDTPIRRRIEKFGKRQTAMLRKATAVVSPSVAEHAPLSRIFALNLTARAEQRIAGNCDSTRLESGVGNCYPGLEFDHRNLDRRFMPGLEVEYVSADDANLERSQGCRLLAVDLGDPGLTPAVGSPDDEAQALSKLRAELGQAARQLGTGDWFVTALTQGPTRIDLFTTDDGGRQTPLDAMTTWRLVRSLVPGPVEIELTARSMPGNPPPPLPHPVVLHGWRRHFTDPATGVIAGAYQPGELTQSLCSPWTHDFRDCACIYWASNHPDVVHVADREDETELPAGSVDDPVRGLMRVNWLRSDRSFERTREARERAGLDREIELDHYEINQRWQELPVVLGDKEVPAVYRPRSENSADPFDTPKELAEELTYLATLEHVLALEYLYAYYSVRTPDEVPDGPLAGPQRQDVEFIRHFVQLVAVNEMQHLRAANQLLWELAEAGLVSRADFGPSLGVAKQVPASNAGGPRPSALRPLTLDVLRDFIAVERPSGTIEGAYAQVVATLRKPEYPDALYQLASRIVNEGEEHFLRFRDIELTMRQYANDANPSPWLRDVKLAARSNPKVKQALKLYEKIIDSLTKAYATGSITDRPHITEARDAMNDLEGESDKLAAGGLGVPFFDFKKDPKK